MNRNSNNYLPKYFREVEFKRCSPACELADMDSDFLVNLDALRALCGFPLILNCAFRAADYDRKRGRSGTSYHCIGRAADIRCYDGQSRRKIIESCLALGLTFGVYKTFIHVDNRNVPIAFYGE